MNLDWLLKYDPVTLALVATLFTWVMTSIGASVVFFFKSISQKIMRPMLGFAAGVMIAASFWSLLKPSIKAAEATGIEPWIPAVSGFLLGGAFLFLIDKLLPHLHLGLSTDKAEGVKTSWKRSILLVLAVTIHNFPEGLAIGVAFGALANDPSSGQLGAAVALAIGIGLQNLPEGVAISVPLRQEGLSRLKSFNYGQLSGIVEPIGGVLGAFLVVSVKPILPYALAFAAGAMIFVVVEELIPSAQRNAETDTPAIGAMLGFAVMMLLDVALGN